MKKEIITEKVHIFINKLKSKMKCKTLKKFQFYLFLFGNQP